MQYFSNESGCETYIKESRENAGIYCKTCRPSRGISGSEEENSLNGAI